MGMDCSFDLVRVARAQSVSHVAFSRPKRRKYRSSYVKRALVRAARVQSVCRAVPFQAQTTIFQAQAATKPLR